MGTSSFIRTYIPRATAMAEALYMFKPSQVVVTGGVLAFAYAVKQVYVNFIRRDVPVDENFAPVFRKLQRPTHASHRGGSRVWPENTMEAFKNSVEWSDCEDGCVYSTNMLEFDIQKTRDGHLVIMHNLSVDSTTDGGGVVEQLTLEYIRSLDAGYWFTRDGGRTYPYRGTGLKVPLLSEVFDAFAGIHGLVFYLDIKAANSVADTLEMVQKYGLQHRVIMGAVPPAANRELLRLKPSFIPATPDMNSMIFMYVCYLVGLLWLVPMRHEIVGTTVHRWGIRVLTERMVRAFHKRKRLIAVFGEHLDTESGQLDCLALGCDLLVTDRPDILHRSMKKWNDFLLGSPNPNPGM
eukprot:TRINITY_DN2927_c0_g1_i4.p1 TRINITY_DN2927_c0_g1~~TRINITY_DN2927_c0_g1_i4.p1  ORF type:complete len:351 (+),score=59.31 TRINITY_DN2927_c0_g1_i4:117-1169(+)